MIKKILEDNENIKSNTRTLGILKEYFPDCFTKDDEFDIERFKNKIASDINTVDYGYELNFLGKNYANLIASQETTTVIEPDIEHNQKEENKNSDNIYISGDNLDAIKHLLNSYSKKIKCIYIDPPYNTNNDDFVYNDSFNFSKDELITKLDISEEKAEKLMSFLSKKSSSHSAWLTFMYPRLLLSRDLLTDDGVIFISIDDNEQANLKFLCDAIYGEENYISNFTRVTKKSGKSSEIIAKNHDYVVAYAKNISISNLEGVYHIDKGYCNKDEYYEERGYYKLNQTLDYDSLQYNKTMDYPYEIGGKVYYAGGSKEGYENRQNGQHNRVDWVWRWSKARLDFGLKNGFIEIREGMDRPRLYTKTYEKASIDKINGEYEIVKINRTKSLSTLEFTDNKYSNDNATKLMNELIGKNIFEYTKPISLISTLNKLIKDKNYIIIDFFSGSATTAHAIMDLNAEDNGTRKYIMVQLPEKIKEGSGAKSKGYETICDIGMDRIEKAAKKYKDKKIDKGFKHFTLKSFNENTLDKIKDFDSNNTNIKIENNIEEEFGLETILTTWINQDGYGLTTNYSIIKFGEYEAYYVSNESLGGNLYLINKDIDETFIEKLIDKIRSDDKFNIKLIVIFGYNFTYSEMQMIENNIAQLSSSGLNLDIAIDKRY